MRMMDNADDDEEDDDYVDEEESNEDEARDKDDEDAGEEDDDDHDDHDDHFVKDFVPPLHSTLGLCQGSQQPPPRDLEPQLSPEDPYQMPRCTVGLRLESYNLSCNICEMSLVSRCF